ncbi:MAG: hypothetical protein HC838_15895 [Spirulinaceae cyanobacterium RM2_2_10]|nr:hypothetical protein [Spirulinaceae cyanobacterium SM2_1_0]NJO21224.1 hypothetical protein [Spirulinaceae cyanobacterium RM2_2_10]
MYHERCHCPRLPLAVYREVAAHLRQVAGVEVELLTQTSSQFDYLASQIEALQLSYPTAVRDRLNAILDYYAQRHGAWQRQPLPATGAIDP